MFWQVDTEEVAAVTCFEVFKLAQVVTEDEMLNLMDSASAKVKKALNMNFFSASKLGLVKKDHF